MQVEYEFLCAVTANNNIFFYQNLFLCEKITTLHNHYETPVTIEKNKPIIKYIQIVKREMNILSYNHSILNCQKLQYDYRTLPILFSGIIARN